MQMQVSIVSQYAFIDFSKNFDVLDLNKTYLSNLISLDRKLKEYFIMIEIKDNIPDNNNKENLQEGDLLLSRNIIKYYWKYDIVNKTEGLKDLKENRI